MSVGNGAVIWSNMRDIIKSAQTLPNACDVAGVQFGCECGGSNFNNIIIVSTLRMGGEENYLQCR